MSWATGPRMGVGLLLVGALFVGMASFRAAADTDPVPSRLLSEFGGATFGLVLAWYGWGCLRRAMAERPDRSWRDFLHTGDTMIGDGVMLGVVSALMAIVAALPPEQRDDLQRSMDDVVRSMLELYDMVSVATGRP